MTAKYQQIADRIVCENCNNDVPEDNIGRVCAYQVDNITPGVLHYKGAITCNCCDKCRNECHKALLKNNPC